MISDTSSDARKVDKKTALAMWDAAILPPTASKKKKEEEAEGTNGTDGDVMNFTVVSRRGNKPQVVK
jgi:regulator of nonsense transcripts 2